MGWLQWNNSKRGRAKRTGYNTKVSTDLQGMCQSKDCQSACSNNLIKIWMFIAQFAEKKIVEALKIFKDFISRLMSQYNKNSASSDMVFGNELVQEKNLWRTRFCPTASFLLFQLIISCKDCQNCLKEKIFLPFRKKVGAKPLIDTQINPHLLKSLFPTICNWMRVKFLPIFLVL